MEQNFDAWGRRRNPTRWDYISVPTLPDWLYRGYTGHEMLDPFVLINMNGRIYDPVVARVLSPDNFVQDPFSTQGYNRYSYGYNNPLKYTDPDGNNPLLGALIGGLGYFLSVAFSEGGFKNWNWGQFAFATIAGAVSSGFATGIGEATQTITNPLLRAGVQVAAHGLVGGYTSVAGGGEFGRGFLTSAAGSVVGSLTGGLPGGVQIGSSAVFGGLVDELNGGNFWGGAAQAGIVAGFNHFMHPVFEGDDPPTKAKKKSNETDLSLEGVEHLIGPGLTVLAAPVPKRFVANNASKTSSVLSEALSEMWPTKINVFGARRLYTHTVNGVPRYAATWGRYFGRWGTRFLGPIGIGLTIYDFSDMIYTNYQNATPIQQQWMANPYRFYGSDLWKK